MWQSRLVILLAFARDIIVVLTSCGTGTGHCNPKRCMDNLHFLVFLTAIKHTLNSASVLCNDTASLITFHEIVLPRIA